MYLLPYVVLAGRAVRVAICSQAVFVVIAALSLQMLTMSAAAQDAPAPTAPSTSEAPADSADTDAEQRLIPQSYGISGLVVDETRTTIGRDFYDTFYETWTAPDGSVNYTIVVEEQPVPGRGTRVLVRLNDEVAFDTRLQPGYDRIREAALAAVGYTRRALASTAPLSRGL